MPNSSGYNPPKHAVLHLSNVLAADRVCILNGTDKRSALDELATLLATSANVTDAAELRRAMHAREALMSTGIGLGIGVPHVRIDSVRDIAMAVGLSNTDIAGYESLDNAPVRLLFMIAAAPSQHAEYIRLLALISRMVKDADVRRSLLSARNGAQLHEILTSGIICGH